MLLRIPKIETKSNALDPTTAYEDIARYLSHTGFRFLGRQWRAIHHRSSSKDENGKRISLAKQDKNLQAVVIMFAESGPGLNPQDSLTPVSHQEAVEWLIPIDPNLGMTQCKFYSRIALGMNFA